MPAAAAKTKAKAPTRAELCRELLEIERDNPEIFRRIEEIKTSLKLQAEKDGSFRETFDKLGWVSASPPKGPRVTGEAPEVDVAVWNALPPAERKKLTKTGVVKIVPVITGASYGQVRTNLFAPPQGAAS